MIEHIIIVKRQFIYSQLMSNNLILELRNSENIVRKTGLRLASNY